VAAPVHHKIESFRLFLPVHSFRSLLASLATVTRNIMAMAQSPQATFVLYPKLTSALCSNFGGSRVV
jgi:hypothetical protein